jgi:hypothetical protein
MILLIFFMGVEKFKEYEANILGGLVKEMEGTSSK